MTIVKKPERVFDDPPMEGEIGILKVFDRKSIEVSVGLVLVVAAVTVWMNISDMTLVKGLLAFTVAIVYGVAVSPLMGWIIKELGVKL